MEALLLSVNKTRTGKLGSEILHNFFIAKIVDDSARSGAGAAILRSWSRRRVKMNGSTALSFFMCFSDKHKLLRDNADGIVEPS